MTLALMAAMAAASEDIFKLFTWNRDVFMFDKSQRLEREELRMKMQIERFNLFREDIKDLVGLTVDRMDMYHLVGALFLHACIILIAEGRMHGIAPPFLLSLYLFNAACGTVYMLYAVWLAMHASIAAQSFGVRLLLRYVRLPLPTNAQIDALASTLAEYETQGVQNALRIPFVQRPQWGPTDVQQEPAAVAARFGGLKLLQDGKQASEAKPGLAPLPNAGARKGMLGKAEVPFAGEDDFMLSATSLPGQHVELFRRLQAKWNCFDAYARISMQFGVQHMLFALGYFSINITMIENRSPTAGWVLVILFQGCQMALSVLDMSAYGMNFIGAVQTMSALPLITTLVSLTFAVRNSTGAFGEQNIYPAAFLPFLFQLAWLELLLQVATPDSDDGRVPRKSRTVFYMDVFGDAEEAFEQREKEREDQTSRMGDATPKTANAHRRTRQHAESVRDAATVVRASVELWEAMPKQALSEGQRREIERLRAQLELCQKVVKDQFEWCAARNVLGTTWDAEMSTDKVHFGAALVGPFERLSEVGPESCYLDLEADDYVVAVPPGRQVVSLARVSSMMQELKARARCLREAAAEAAGNKEGLSKGIPRTREEYESMLPWRVLSWSSRVVQFCLAWMSIASILRETRLWKIDYHNRHAGERRLAAAAAAEFAFGRLEVRWPQGPFFHPEVLSCMPGGNGSSQLLLGSPFKQYEAGVGSASDTWLPLRLSELAGPQFPPTAAALCASPEDFRAAPACLMGLPTAGGVIFWPMGSGPTGADAVTLAVEGRPWRRLAGAAVRCSEADASRADAEEGPPSPEDWCLLLAGWDGESVPVAVLRLPGGPGTAPEAGSIRPRFDIPMPATDTNATGLTASTSGLCADPDQECEQEDGERVALHLEPKRGRLWALVDGGELRAWELLRPRSLGSWRPSWPKQVKDFQGAALCHQDGSGLLVVGRGASSGPSLLRAELPKGFGTESWPPELADLGSWPATDE